MGIINDVRIGKTSVGVRAAEVYMKLKGYGKESIDLNDNRDILKELLSMRQGNALET